MLGKVHIEKLSHQTLKRASEVADQVFLKDSASPDWRYIPHEGFAVSLEPEKLADYNRKKNGVLSGLDFWVAIDETSGDVVGTTGIYGLSFDPPDLCWLAWFCVDKKQRGRGIGSQLLNFTIEEARRRGKKILRLYTSTDPNEGSAQKIYEGKCFRIVPELGREKYGTGIYEIFYRELAL